MYALYKIPDFNNPDWLLLMEVLLPDNCLLVAKENFGKYFGPVFSSRATFSLTEDINPNFSEPKRMASIIPGVGDNIARDIVLKRPYYNEEEFYAKHPRIKRQ
ncbi:10508_t:CDS:2, partial [Gigaspora rosea]